MATPYSEILDLTYPRALNHPRMTVAERAAQFMPFAALAGHEAVLAETARKTEPLRELTQAAADECSMRLNALMALPVEHRHATITYFVPDGRKSGGAYHRRSVSGLSIDPERGLITLSSELQIPVSSVYAIECEGFDW